VSVSVRSTAGGSTVARAFGSPAPAEILAA
jgi:hypothetical protein